MDKIEFLEARIGILEGALSTLIQYEMSQSAYGSDRHNYLKNIHQNALAETELAQTMYEDK